MKDLVAICSECEKDLSAIGIKIGQVTEYVVNSRAKRRLGLCHKNRSGGFIIQISDVLLRDEVSVKELKNTIYHEQLHTCPGCMNHGENWQRLAHKVNIAYGMSVSRVADPDAIATKIHLTESREQAKYRYECQNCGRIHVNMRASGFTKHPERYICGKCGTVGKWKRIF